jgi:hypothetical protein
MQFTQELIGSRLMEILTSGLYDGNLNCLREYVQNSIDSKANNIEIYFENNSNLIIKDDGSGMDKEELRRALGIGISSKLENNVGWRGIGIWSGVPACRKIVIITKKHNSNKYRIEINCDIITEQSNNNMDLFDIMAKATGEIENLPLGISESLKEDHFTIVRLESILQTQKMVFSSEEIYKYLSRVIPAPFDKSKFLFADEIDTWLQINGITMPNVNIKFESKKIFRNPTRSDIFFNDVAKKEFKVKNKLIAIGWFLTGKRNETLKAPNNGIYFRKKGFTIGDERLVEALNPTDTYHPWQYGEIHIVSNEIRENAPRNNFERNNLYLDDLFKDIGEFIKNLENQNRIQGAVNPKEMKQALSLLIKSEFSSAKDKIEAAKRKIGDKRKFPQDESIKNMEKVLTELGEQNLKDLSKLEEIRNTSSLEENSNILKEIEFRLNNMGNIHTNNTKNEITKPPNAENTPSIAEKTLNLEIIDGIEKPAGSAKSLDLPKESIATNGKPIPSMHEKSEPLLDVILKNLRPEVKTYVARSKGLERFEISATDSIRDLLIKKVGSFVDKKEIAPLSRVAYGWGEVTQGKTQLLAIDKNIVARNWRFGAMIYTIHDLFINMDKHERGTDSFKWFEEAPSEERKILIAEAYAVIDLMYRLIEKSQDNK